MKTAPDSIRHCLTLFWQSLSSQHQKEIGQHVSFIVASIGSSSVIMAITREKIENLGIVSGEFQRAIELFERLTPDEKLGINSQLSSYFISRNK